MKYREEKKKGKRNKVQEKLLALSSIMLSSPD